MNKHIRTVILKPDQADYKADISFSSWSADLSSSLNVTFSVLVSGILFSSFRTSISRFFGQVPLQVQRVRPVPGPAPQKLQACAEQGLDPAFLRRLHPYDRCPEETRQFRMPASVLIHLSFLIHPHVLIFFINTLYRIPLEQINFNLLRVSLYSVIMHNVALKGKIKISEK